MGSPDFVDGQGQKHDWRTELFDALARRQGSDGSWVNPDDRFMEGEAHLVTAYGRLALTYVRPRS